MKIKNVSVVNDENVAINYIDNDGKDQVFWFNGTTNPSEATLAFVALKNAGLL